MHYSCVIHPNVTYCKDEVTVHTHARKSLFMLRKELAKTLVVLWWSEWLLV